jgi:hypothetical protein
MCRRFFAIEGLRFGTLLEPSTIRLGAWSGMQQFRDQETPAEATPVGGGDIAEVSNRIEKPDFRAAFDAAFRASVARRVGFGIHADKVRLAQAHENKRLMDEIRNRDAEIEQLHGEVRIRSTEIERLRAENRNHVAEIGQLLMEIEHLIEQYRAVLVSTSWRLTAPGRLLKTWLIRHIVGR